MEDLSLVKLYKRHVRGTVKNAVVANVTIFLCNLTNAVIRDCGIKHPKIYITSRMLKHIYDKRPAEEFDTLLKEMWQIVKFPDEIYKNDPTKRGSLIFLKQIGNFRYFSSIECVETGEIESQGNYVATAFRIHNEKYMEKYEMIWSWKGGNLHRNSFDTAKQPTNIPQ